MRYAGIIDFDIANGEGIGVALFVQGCHFHCKGCFNEDTWNFEGGKEFTDKVEEDFMNLIKEPQITRVTILGGEPLCDENVEKVCNLIYKIRQSCNRSIWIYTGYTYEDIRKIDVFNINSMFDWLRFNVIAEVDVLVDGKFIEEKKDLTLKFRGSSNQRVIDIAEMRENGNYRDIILKEGY